MVSVRKGSNSGFGFTIYPGNGETKDLDENHVIVGQVLEGLDVIETLNNLPVVTSAKVRQRTGRNILVLCLLILRLLCIKVQNSEFREGPSRACRYGGTQLYCNEFKPLQKLTMYQTGVL